MDVRDVAAGHKTQYFSVKPDVAKTLAKEVLFWQNTNRDLYTIILFVPRKELLCV